jgi:hypothetical protein
MRRPFQDKHLIANCADKSIIMADQNDRCAMGDALAQG